MQNGVWQEEAFAIHACKFFCDTDTKWQVHVWHNYCVCLLIFDISDVCINLSSIQWNEPDNTFNSEKLNEGTSS